MVDNIINILLMERTSGGILNVSPEVKCRFQKDLNEQKNRCDNRGEVFTPFSIVKKMTGFDIAIDKVCLDMCCGEATFITTRYDVETGEDIPIEKRCGLLDKKLRQCECKEDAITALKTTFGYELMEDNLFISRRNVFETMMESGFDLDENEVAEIISYNFFLMDGLTSCLPNTDEPSRFMDWATGKFERFDDGGEPEELF